MTRIVWWTLLVALVALAGFILFLTFTGDPIPKRGFVIAAGLLAVGWLPYSKLRGERGPP